MFTYWEKIQFFAGRFVRFILLVARQYEMDRGPRIASALTFTSLLALVPLFAVVFALFSRFPPFYELLELGQNYLLDTFAPSVGLELKDHIDAFVFKTQRLTSLGLLALVVSVFFTLHTVDYALNDIWHVNRQRNPLIRILVYFTIVLVGPLLLVVSIGLSTYVVSIPLFEELLGDEIISQRLLPLLSILTALSAFTFIYKWVPGTTVRWFHALLGGLTAWLLFELAKWGFTLYLKWFPSYEIIYGAIAAIPLTLIWLFVLWTVVLIGAQVSHCLSFFRWRPTVSPEDEEWSMPPEIAVRILGRLYAAGSTGLTARALRDIEAGLSVKFMRKVLERLAEEGFVVDQGKGRWRWADSNVHLSVSEFLHRFGRSLEVLSQGE